MGSCVKCGKKTDFHYIYYTGTLVNAEYTDTAEVKTYSNVSSHEHFLCGKCVNWSSGFLKILYVIFGLSVLGFLFMCYIILYDIMHKGSTEIGIIIFTCVPIAGILIIGRLIAGCRKDKAFDENEGSDALSKIMRRKIKKGETAFNIEEHGRLVKNYR
jgi:hypothetical protein